MSEVGEASQIVIATGRGAYLLAGIAFKAAVGVVKLINTIHLSKWKGRTHLGRLRAIKGEDMLYLNAGTEDKKVLRKIQKEMKKHGILFVRMPDLCGGDGRTQYAISVSDAPKVRALLINHAIGPFKDTYLGMMSEKDYLSTAFDRDGNMTEEMKDLSRSAREAAAETEEKKASQSKASAFHDQAPEHDMEYGSPDQQVNDLKKAFSDVRIRLRDMDLQGLQNQYQWISGPPLEIRKNFAEFQIDRDHTVFIPVSDAVLPGRSAGSKSLGAALFYDRAYTVTNLQTATFKTLAGPTVMALVKEAVINRNSGAQTVGTREVSKDQKIGGFEGPTSGLENLSSMLNKGKRQEPSLFEKKL